MQKILFHLKKFIKSLLKVLLMFFCLFIALILTLAEGERLAEYRANTLCEAAMSKKSITEVLQLVDNTKHIKRKNASERFIKHTNSIMVEFSSFFFTSYTCIVNFDLSEERKPISYDVAYRD